MIQDRSTLPVALPATLPPVGNGPTGFTPLERRILASLLAMPFLLVALGLHFLERERYVSLSQPTARGMFFVFIDPPDSLQGACVQDRIAGCTDGRGDPGVADGADRWRRTAG